MNDLDLVLDHWRGFPDSSLPFLVMFWVRVRDRLVPVLDLLVLAFLEGLLGSGDGSFERRGLPNGVPRFRCRFPRSGSLGWVLWIPS